MEAPTQKCSVTLPWAWASQSCIEDMSVSARVHSTVAMSIGMCVYIGAYIVGPETNVVFFFFFQYCAGQRFIAALSHTGGQARKN